MAAVLPALLPLLLLLLPLAGFEEEEEEEEKEERLVVAAVEGRSAAARNAVLPAAAPTPPLLLRATFACSKLHPVVWRRLKRRDGDDEPPIRNGDIARPSSTNTAASTPPHLLDRCAGSPDTAGGGGGVGEFPNPSGREEEEEEGGGVLADMAVGIARDGTNAEAGPACACASLPLAEVEGVDEDGHEDGPAQLTLALAPAETGLKVRAARRTSVASIDVLERRRLACLWHTYARITRVV